MTRASRDRIAAFARSVNGEATGLVHLDDTHFDAVVAELRGALRREGLREALLSRGFALVREAAGQVLGKWHYDCQIIGGWVLLNGMLAEMGTGEGKTLTANLPEATVAMAGLPVHGHRIVDSGLNTLAFEV
mgnify:CR=1 FL=1